LNYLSGASLAGSASMMSANILLVEDNPINQVITSRLLTQWGHQVTIANDGNDALQKIHYHQFSLVLMDIHMPGMDGYETTQLIRSLDDPYFKKLPILAFTSCTLKETKEKAEQIGMTGFLIKPFQPEEMQHKINQYIMKTTSFSSATKPLNIQFANYTDGNPDSKLELINLIAANIKELQQAVHNAYHLRQFHVYQNVAHKVKSSILLLNDPELTKLYEEVKTIFKSMDSDPGIERVNHFIKLLAETLKSLEEEAQSIRHA
jgi:CheY-like chemotaxis protein